MSRTKALVTNENGQLITEDIKSIVKDANRISAGAVSKKRDLEDVLRSSSYNGAAGDQKAKKDLQKKVNNLMRKYNVK